MAKPIGTTAPRLELGIRLRQIRKGQGMTIEEAVKGLPGINYDKLRRIEIGESSFRTIGDLRRLLSWYGAEDDHELVEYLEELYKTPPSQDWTTQFRKVPDGTRAFAGIESAAFEARVYHPNVVPGQLQTEEYALAQYREVQPIEETTTEFIESNVALRMLRRKQFTRPDSPAKLHVILGEAALRHPVGDRLVMLGQYEEILRMADLPHVTIQLLLIEAKVKRLWHNFTVLDLGRDKPTTVQIDTGWGPASMSDKPSSAARFTRWFQTMSASAEPPEETPAFINNLKREET
ncbi:helix-turn-helix domain-containing protein [Streptomyces violascens]|uniref:helix-turn-helix domain-containing protein n=1 Tax=Streptomyces violascens TaxID=67381 RepID=UPI00365A38F8